MPLKILLKTLRGIFRHCKCHMKNYSFRFNTSLENGGRQVKERTATILKGINKFAI